MTSTIDAAAARGGKVLFVDDEALSLKYFKAAVGKYADVLTAENAEAAMEILAAEGDAISVVVSDERMPRESGVHFLANVRKSWPSTVRILTSAYTNVDLQEAINSAAISRFVPKPWNFDELCDVLKDALRSEQSSGNTYDAEGVEPADIEPNAEKRYLAESASLELLAVLTRELTDPLAEIDAESLRLAAYTGVETSPAPFLSSTWSRRLHLGQITASAARIRALVAHCRAVAKPIADVADGLVVGVAVTSHSMAKTLSDVGEQIARTSAGRVRLSVDARNDFEYSAPRKIVEFVLVQQLDCAYSPAETRPSDIAVKLVPGPDYNDVEITAAISLGSDAPEIQRASRCALWAFGGELLIKEIDGRHITTLRFPVAPGSPRDGVKH